MSKYVLGTIEGVSNFVLLKKAKVKKYNANLINDKLK